ncbi:branched-chain amino acid ABC transporter permease [Salipiger marinus]|uniref:Amino acid/amide ABC transporter membrane protein 2, HAAT family n=1 Tax=Salipiger marinus TaxID=555512 RepID=A0A1G8TW72_9RHOB|nr:MULTISPECIES: branched-chain amino acid ABC transporter permease [Salipiger]MEB3420653.1 branched-chain amino acid ABC transporter permease [Salipiger manganoxidans]SDJ45697.1 amino acid/amide ABC transporter membrane protein 2, HAAT family [Salipiger marinus]
MTGHSTSSPRPAPGSRGLPLRSLLTALGVLALAVIPVMAPGLQLLVNLALAKGLAVLGVTVLLRAGQVSFGHALFFGVSAYAGAFCVAALPGADLVLVLVAGVIGAALAGLLVGLFVVRYRGIFFGMLNLAFSMIFWSILEKFYHVTGGADGIRLDRPTVLGMELGRGAFELVLFYLAIALVLGLGWFTLRWFASPVGQLFQTIKTNETRLEYLGLSPRRVLLSGYLLSAVLCGVGGSLMGMTQGVVTPEYVWWVRSAEMVFIAVLGGAGSVRGAFVGALIYEMVRVYASAFAGDIWQMLLGAFLLVIILFAPGGIMGILDGLMRRATPARAPARTKEAGQ